MAESFPKKRPQLVMDPQTRKLREVAPSPNPEHFIEVEMTPAGHGFFGGCFIATKGNEGIRMLATSEGYIDVKTMHISCQSDTYQPGHNYAGIIIYQYDGKSEWRTANNTHCKSGYIVIQDTDSENVKKWIGKEPGAVHGAVYRNAFGESVKGREVIGEGFAYRNGKCEINSSVFNNPKDSGYHDNRRRMHELSEHCVGKIVEHWKTSGSSWVRQRNFQVKELLEGCDTRAKYRCPRCNGRHH